MKNTVVTTRAPRTELMDLLDKLSEKRLVYIHAPAGYGKTVSTQMCLERKKSMGTKHAWITLDEYDNKAMGFCKRFANALLGLRPGNMKLREILTHPAFNSAPEEFVIQALNEFYADRHKYILVIDDLHLINRESVLKLFGLFFKRLPENFIVFLLSRSAPPDVFAEFSLKDALAIVDAKDLRFSGDEIKLFFDKNGHYITKKQADDIFLSTGGWAIGLRAMLMSGETSYEAKLKGRYLDTFLKAHVWEKWDKKIRDCMMKAAVADELTPDLFNALTGVKNGREILVELAKENAFLRDVDSGHTDTYRFHDLFREFLLNMLEREGGSLKSEQMKKVGDWFYNQKEYYRAVEYYLKCDDISGMAKALGFMYDYNSSYASIEDTVAIIRLSVGDAAVKKYPFLLETLAWAAFVEGNGDEMEGYLDRYFKQLPKIIIQNPVSLHTSFLLQTLDYRNSVVDVTKSLKKLPLKIFTKAKAKTPSITQNLPFLHRSAREFCAEYAFNTDENLILMEKTIGRLFNKDEYKILETLVRTGVKYERGNLDEAYEYALSAAVAIKDAFAPEFQFSVYAILVAISAAQNRHTEVEKNLKAAQTMIEFHKAYYLNANYRALSCRLELADGNTDSAQNWLKNNDDSIYNTVSFYKLYRHFTSARAYIVVEDYNTAILLLKKLLNLSEKYRRPLDITESCILLAVAYRKKGGKGRTVAFEYLERAVKEAYRYGYVQIFFDMGADIVTMLHTMQKCTAQSGEADGKKIPGEFIKSLYFSALTSSKQNKGLGGEVMPKNLSFTEQQKTVMRFMCEGFNRKEIAKKMNISSDGVKSHMKLIYKKLDVSGVPDAIVKIKKHEILSDK
ncbi:MAG: LuxR C-terminal-related transcriptional regulator [Oscillospiraceae bacterium]|nr:LuxR C-terminal-related transcriptional regulator [Oscillospiraceae bacterium]